MAASRRENSCTSDFDKMMIDTSGWAKASPCTASPSERLLCALLLLLESTGHPEKVSELCDSLDSHEDYEEFLIEDDIGQKRKRWKLRKDAIPPEKKDSVIMLFSNALNPNRSNISLSVIAIAMHYFAGRGRLLAPPGIDLLRSYLRLCACGQLKTQRGQPRTLALAREIGIMIEAHSRSLWRLLCRSDVNQGTYSVHIAS